MLALVDRADLVHIQQFDQLARIDLVTLTAIFQYGNLSRMPISGAAQEKHRPAKAGLLASGLLKTYVN